MSTSPTDLYKEVRIFFTLTKLLYTPICTKSKFFTNQANNSAKDYTAILLHYTHQKLYTKPHVATPLHKHVQGALHQTGTSITVILTDLFHCNSSVFYTVLANSIITQTCMQCFTPNKIFCYNEFHLINSKLFTMLVLSYLHSFSSSMLVQIVIYFLQCTNVPPRFSTCTTVFYHMHISLDVRGVNKFGLFVQYWQILYCSINVCWCKQCYTTFFGLQMFTHYTKKV